MSWIDPRLAWTLLLSPRRRDAGRPAWPQVVARRFGEVDPGRVDPIEEILRGPWPLRVLAQADGGDALLCGLGDGIAMSGIGQLRGEVEDDGWADALRRRAIGALLGGAAGGSDAEVEGLLADLEADPAWEVEGLVEVAAALCEGLPDDLPDEGGWLQQGSHRIQRAAGVGEGHAAWHVEAWYGTPAERSVAAQRVDVLCRGFDGRLPALIDYGSRAVRWGRGARDALRRSRALEAVLGEVRVGASWAVAGGPVPGPGIPDLPRLAARLDTARVALQEVVCELGALRPGLARAAERILGTASEAEPHGPFVEASARAGEMLETLGGRVEAAARWADALRTAREAQAGASP